MSSPWLKFYPTDWRADPALRMCSVAARGLWMEMLCVMHEAEPYGSLRVNGKSVSDKQLAGLAGISADEAFGLLAELEASGVFSRDAEGAILSRRMQRDKAKAETDKANGKRGGNPKIVEGVNPPVNGEDKAQKPEARDQTSEANASAAVAAVDWRAELWTKGSEFITRHTGKTGSASRSLIGKWLKDAKDDCRLVLSKMQQAEADGVLEPISWVTAAIRPPPDKPKKITHASMWRDEGRAQGLLPNGSSPHEVDGRLETSHGERLAPGSDPFGRIAGAGSG